MRAIELSGLRHAWQDKVKTGCVLNNDAAADRYLQNDQALAALSCGDYSQLVRTMASDALCPLDHDPDFVVTPDHLQTALRIQDVAIEVAQGQPANAMAMALFQHMAKDTTPGLMFVKGRPLEALAAVEADPERRRFLHAGALFFGHVNPAVTPLAAVLFGKRLDNHATDVEQLRAVFVTTAQVVGAIQPLAGLSALLSGKKALTETWQAPAAASDALDEHLMDVDVRQDPDCIERLAGELETLPLSVAR